jgi:hypothetical protein
MNQVYPTKISWWLFGPILALPLLPLLTWRGHPAEYIGLLVLLLVAGYLLFLMRTTRYIITPEQLQIRCGWSNQQIVLEQIRKIAPTHNPLSSPALSLDRLEISFGKYDMVLISPQKKQEFIDALLAQNPTIQLASHD